MRKLWVIVLILFVTAAKAQPVNYTVSNAHSHNDYEQKMPFWLAYNHGFGSIEADIFLLNDSLYIAHDTIELKARRTLEAYYLQPLAKVVSKNRNYPYADSTRHLQLLIDIKTDSIHTLDKLISVLQTYPALINNRMIKFVITGNRPDQSLFTSYPSFVSFDGELFKNYSKEALTRISLLSDDFKNYVQWKGAGTPTPNELAVLTTAVNKAHQLGKPVRFWDSPDFINAWKQFIHLGVDYINTDHIPELSSFLASYK
jgi:alkaline phosphatase